MPKGPKANSQTSAAMVPAQVVLAGGAGLTSEVQTACDKVFAQFDPPIVTGKYGKLDIAAGQQREHGVANSAVQGTRGNSATNVPGASGYTEGGGFCFTVFDGQSAGTEHKWLTDAAKEFHESLQAAGKRGTLRDHLNQSQKNWEKSFQEKLRRKKRQAPRSRIKDAEKKSKKERDALAKAAAKCLRMMAEQAFRDQKVPLSTVMRNGLSAAVKAAKRVAKKGAGF